MVVLCMFTWDILQQLCNELFVRLRTQSHRDSLTIGIRPGLLCNFFRPRHDRKATILLTCKMTNHSLFCFYVPFRGLFSWKTTKIHWKTVYMVPCKLKRVRSELTGLRNYGVGTCACLANITAPFPTNLNHKLGGHSCHFGICGVNTGRHM